MLILGIFFMCIGCSGHKDETHSKREAKLLDENQELLKEIAGLRAELTALKKVKYTNDTTFIFPWDINEMFDFQNAVGDKVFQILNDVDENKLTRPEIKDKLAKLWIYIFEYGKDALE